MNPIRKAVGSLALLALAVAAPALAHPQLVQAAPSQASTASNVRAITLRFSERLIAPMSGFDVTIIAMPGMGHAMNGHPIKLPGVKATVAGDGKTLRAQFPRSLSPGTYVVNWHAVSVDTHRIAGKVTFTVR